MLVSIPPERIAQEMLLEMDRAIGLYKSINSLHEAYAIILEEVDEFWEEVRENGERLDGDTSEMRKELIQIGAMAIRTIYDLGL